MSGFPGGRATPNAVKTLGFEFLAADTEAGTAEVSFEASTDFANLMGNVQGGFVCAMIDAAASSALLAQLPEDQFAPTIEMKTNFLRPVPTGPVVGRGRVVHRGKSIAFLEASLHDADGTLLATGTTTVRIVTA